MATETAVPFSGSTISTSQQYRDRYRPTQPNMIDDAIGGTSLAVANSGNTAVTVQNGTMLTNAGMYTLSAGPLSLSVAANGGGSNRFDIVCITYDAGHSPPIYARIVQGTAGAGLPALTNSLTGVWDEPIAHYEKQPGGNIVNVRDRRKFADGEGGTLAADDTTGTAVDGWNVGWFPPAPRIGQLQQFWPSGATYYWNGSAWKVLNYGAIPPQCRLKNSASQTIGTSSDTALTFDTEDYDHPIYAMHSTVSNTSRITFPVDGTYELKAITPWASNATGKRECVFVLNGSTTFSGAAIAGTSAGRICLNFSAHVSVNAGDYAQSLAWQDSGGNLSVDQTFRGGQRFEATWIGPKTGTTP